jgi:Serine dehydrogenase proteinase
MATPKTTKAGSRAEPKAKQARSGGTKAVPKDPSGESRSLGKTPFFTAANAARYQRQALIKEIDQRQRTTLICYVSSDRREIERDDVFGFVDLLHNIPAGAPIDLMLHTLGGNVDAAEKIMIQIRRRLGEHGRLRVIIPNYAKSAGTLMALGAHSLLMSETSELGMIDPQIVLKDERGNEICTSVIAYLEAYDAHFNAVRSDPGDQASQIMLQQFDPVVVRKLRGQRDRTRDIALKLLNRVGAPSTTISENLMNLSLWKSHGQMIGAEDAREIGLTVEYVSVDDEVWQMYWHLLCLQRLEVDPDKKIFESAWVSQVFER